VYAALAGEWLPCHRSFPELVIEFEAIRTRDMRAFGSRQSEETINHSRHSLDFISSPFKVIAHIIVGVEFKHLKSKPKGGEGSSQLM
jgi:hypothetical protein